MTEPGKKAPRSRADLLLAQFHEEQAVATQAVDWQMLRDLWPYARPHLRLYLVALALMPIGAWLMTLQPRLLQRAVDAVGFGGDGRAVLADVAMLYAAVIFARFVTGFIETYAMQLAGQRTLADLRAAVFAHIQKLSIRYFDRTPVGRVVTRVTNDIDSIGELFGTGAVGAIGDVFLLVFIVVSMLSIDVELSLVAFAVVPPLIVVVELFRRYLRKTQRRIRAMIAQLNAFLNEQVQGIQVVQAFSREDECARAYEELNESYRNANFRAIRADASMYSVVEAISTVCIGMVLWYAARRLGALGSAEEAEALKGTFIALYAYIQQFFVPVRDLSTKYTTIQSAFASAERVFGLLSVKDFDAAGHEEHGLPAVDPKAPIVSFEHVRFRYKEQGDDVLDDVSFAVRRGETIALVGATGAGKTTVTSLLNRFYDVREGSVKVGGVDVRRFEREALRKHFATVQQDVFLFSGTLLENVSFGDSSPDPARVHAALERLGTLRLFEARGGLAMDIRERGMNLSAGERQLIAFARALYCDPEVLILDEATANVDSETEAQITHAVETLLEGRTAIVIAHRLSTIRRADRILVFHRGHIVEQGPHSELVEKGGVYARLYQLQFASVARSGSEAAAAPQ